MNTTLTEISNIFNLMVQADSRLKFYHFGWRSDINKNIDNNFDKGVKTGRLFPALHFDVPDFFQPSEELNYLGFKEDIAVNLYFDDLQNYDNSGEQKTDNLIEQWAALKQITEDFISNLSEVLQYYKAGFIRTVPRFEPKSNLFNDRLITFEVSFTIAHISECTEEIHKINLLSLPGSGCFPAYDLENYKQEIECKSLNLDGVNEYIQAPINAAFDLTKTDPMSFGGWVKFDSIVNAQYILQKHASGKGILFAVRSTGELQLHLQNNGGLNALITNSSGALISTGVWLHLAVTYDGSNTNSGVKFYKNGGLLPNTIVTNSLTGTITNTEPVKIGTLFNGLLNVVRWWKTELTPTEILNFYNCDINTPKQSDLILNTNIGASFWNGTAFEIPDLTGITTGYISVNSEEADLLTDCP